MVWVWSKLHWAVVEGNLAQVKLLLEGGAEGSVKYAAGWSPLHCVHIHSSSNSAAIIELLVRAGAEVESRSDLGNTPLMLSVLSDHQAAVRALLDMKNGKGETALDIAT